MNEEEYNRKIELLKLFADSYEYYQETSAILNEISKPLPTQN